MSDEPAPTQNPEQEFGIRDAASAPCADVRVSLLPKRWRRREQLAMLVSCMLVVWLIVAYLLMPSFWKGYARRHPSLDDIPRITYTSSDIPGDPLNLALIGTETELEKCMLAARWYPADALTLRSCLRIAGSTVIKRPYDEAPVSNLFLYGRKQDLAFEQPVGDNPRKRHHVRFWRSRKVDSDGRPVWIGAAIYDRRVGFSHTTGQITHRTDADIDAERNKLFDDLRKTGELAEEYTVTGFHTSHEGRNGGGDPWKTDGNLVVGVIRRSGSLSPSDVQPSD